MEDNKKVLVEAWNETMDWPEVGGLKSRFIEDVDSVEDEAAAEKVDATTEAELPNFDIEVAQDGDKLTVEVTPKPVEDEPAEAEASEEEVSEEEVSEEPVAEDEDVVDDAAEDTEETVEEVEESVNRNQEFKPVNKKNCSENDSDHLSIHEAVVRRALKQLESARLAESIDDEFPTLEDIPDSWDMSNVPESFGSYSYAKEGIAWDYASMLNTDGVVDIWARHDPMGVAEKILAYLPVFQWTDATGHRLNHVKSGKPKTTGKIFNKDGTIKARDQFEITIDKDDPSIATITIKDVEGTRY